MKIISRIVLPIVVAMTLSSATTASAEMGNSHGCDLAENTAGNTCLNESMNQECAAQFEAVQQTKTQRDALHEELKAATDEATKADLKIQLRETLQTLRGQRSDMRACRKASKAEAGSDRDGKDKRGKKGKRKGNHFGDKMDDRGDDKAGRGKGGRNGRGGERKQDGGAVPEDCRVLSRAISAMTKASGSLRFATQRSEGEYTSAIEAAVAAMSAQIEVLSDQLNDCKASNG